MSANVFYTIIPLKTQGFEAELEALELGIFLADCHEFHNLVIVKNKKLCPILWRVDWIPPELLQNFLLLGFQSLKAYEKKIPTEEQSCRFPSLATYRFQPLEHKKVFRTSDFSTNSGRAVGVH